MTAEVLRPETPGDRVRRPEVRTAHNRLRHFCLVEQDRKAAVSGMYRKAAEGFEHQPGGIAGHDLLDPELTPVGTHRAFATKPLKVEIASVNERDLVPA